MSAFPKSELLNQFPEAKKKKSNSNINTNKSFASFPGSALIDNFITKGQSIETSLNNRRGSEKLFVIELPLIFREKYNKKYIYISHEYLDSESLTVTLYNDIISDILPHDYYLKITNKTNNSFELQISYYDNNTRIEKKYKYKYDSREKLKGQINIEDGFIAGSEYTNYNDRIKRNLPDLEGSRINNYSIVNAKLIGEVPIILQPSNVSATNNTISHNILLVEIPDNIKSKIGVNVKYFAVGEKQFIEYDQDPSYTKLLFDKTALSSNTQLKDILFTQLEHFVYIDFLFNNGDRVREMYDPMIGPIKSTNQNNISNYLCLLNYNITDNISIYKLNINYDDL